MDGDAEPVIKYSGSDYGGIRTYTFDYRIVYLGFGFEAINGSQDRSTLMYRSIEWLNKTDKEPYVILEYPANGSSFNENEIWFNVTVLDDFKIDNVTLYGDFGGSWEAQTTVYPNNNTEIGVKLELDEGTYTWNYLAYDNTSQNDWGIEDRMIHITSSITTTTTSTTTTTLEMSSDGNETTTTITSTTVSTTTTTEANATTTTISTTTTTIVEMKGSPIGLILIVAGIGGAVGTTIFIIKFVGVEQLMETLKIGSLMGRVSKAPEALSTTTNFILKYPEKYLGGKVAVTGKLKLVKKGEFGELWYTLEGESGEIFVRTNKILHTGRGKLTGRVVKKDKGIFIQLESFKPSSRK